MSAGKQWVDVWPAPSPDWRHANAAALLERIPHKPLSDGRCRIGCDTVAGAVNLAALLRSYGACATAIHAGDTP